MVFSIRTISVRFLNPSFAKIPNFVRDIKPENILMTSRTDDINLKLADFGFAVKSGVPAAKQNAGTPGYIAPEILLGKPHGE